MGIFDSGLGGLSILREIIYLLPQYNYIYLGDNARAPYGDRTKEQIYSLTKNAVDFLFKNDCELVILACNTASANALRRLQKEYLPKSYPDRKILGIILPVAEYEAERKFKKIGVMATQATVSSKSYVKEIKKIHQNAEVFQVACPILVPMIEEGEIHDEEFDLVLDKYSHFLTERNIDTLILGCTHYALVSEKIKKHFPSSVEIISQGKIIANKLKIYLHRHPEIENKLSKNSKIKYLVTDVNPRFRKLSKLFLGNDIKLELAKY